MNDEQQTIIMLKKLAQAMNMSKTINSLLKQINNEVANELPTSTEILGTQIEVFVQVIDEILKMDGKETISEGIKNYYEIKSMREMYKDND